MASKRQNNRCPLQAECEKVCKWQGSELDCPYYEANARPGCEIEDQEGRRYERWRQGEFALLAADDDEDEDELLESPSDAENAAVSPVEAADEVSILPASLHLDGSNGVTEKIKRAMYDAAKSFVYIGFLLDEVARYEYFLEKGYCSVYEYAEKELGFKRSSTKNFMAVNYEFGCRNSRAHGGIAHERTMTLQPEYKDFNYSQLCEMLSMSEKQRSKVTPDMTVRQIRDLKRREREPDLPPNMETIPIPLSDDPVTSGQTSGQSDDCCGGENYHCLNNVWRPIGSVVVRALVNLAGLKYDPRSRYYIRIINEKDA